MPSGPTRDPHTRPAINTLERLHPELGGQILENKQRHEEPITSSKAGGLMGNRQRRF
jgi:hypothetical protein